MQQTQFKEAEEYSHIDLIVKGDFTGGHNSLFSRFFVSVDLKSMAGTLYNPQLCVAGAGSKPHNTGDPFIF